MSFALVIGGGPAGLMAAEVMAAAGVPVVVTEAKPTVGRKLLLAGKSGLNLTRAEPLAAFAARYGEAEPMLAPMLAAFGPDAVQDWARGLGQAVFTGSTGRVFPVAMKASTLLRAWLARLGDAGVALRTRWRWQGFDEGGYRFDTPQGPQVLHPSVTVLALGGASWARLGSDAAWLPWLAAKGVQVAPFRPANMGFSVAWSAHMTPCFGRPLKAVALTAAGQRVRGEAVISARGLEGGGIYALSRALRDGAALTIDLLPDLDTAAIMAALARQGSATLANHLRKALHLDPVRLALLQEFGRPLPQGAALVRLLKALPVPLTGPRPIDEAISVAGGITRAALTGGLELRARPGCFAAGEMLDWEAPTGGYLLTACLATGRWAGDAAASRFNNQRGAGFPDDGASAPH